MQGTFLALVEEKGEEDNDSMEKPWNNLEWGL